jgi:hypothetical protein
MNKLMQRRHWAGLLAFCLLRVMALSLAFAVVLVGACLAIAGGDPPQTGGQQSPPRKVSSEVFTGVITDAECGARHSKDAKMSSAECAQFCVKHGSKYTLVDGETNYILIGRAAELARLAGQRVKVSGTRDGNTIQVSSLSQQ